MHAQPDGRGRTTGVSPEGETGRKREDGAGVRWEAIAPGLSFCTEVVLYVLPMCTVGGKVYAAPMQSHPLRRCLRRYDTIGEFDWTARLAAN